MIGVSSGARFTPASYNGTGAGLSCTTLGPAIGQGYEAPFPFRRGALPVPRRGRRERLRDRRPAEGAGFEEDHGGAVGTVVGVSRWGRIAQHRIRSTGTPRSTTRSLAAFVKAVEPQMYAVVSGNTAGAMSPGMSLAGGHAQEGST